MTEKSLKERWAEHASGPTSSLRYQLIEAIACHEGWEESAIALYDEAIWPILKAAMEAGELLVSRNTAVRVPVHEAAVNWIHGMAALAKTVRADEDIISKRTLLNIVYKLEESAQRALNDIHASAHYVDKDTGLETLNLNHPVKSDS